MPVITETPFARLEADGLLVKPTLKADTHVAGRFGYRGEIAFDGPDTVMREVFAVSEAGRPAIAFLAGEIKHYDALPKFIESLGSALDAEGKYFVYIADLRQGTRLYLHFGDIKVFAVFIDETSVYNDLIDTFYVDKVKLKKFDTAAKLDALAEVGLKYDTLSSYSAVSYEDGAKQKQA